MMKKSAATGNEECLQAITTLCHLQYGSMVRYASKGTEVKSIQSSKGNCSELIESPTGI